MLESMTYTLAVDEGYDGPALPDNGAPAGDPAGDGQSVQPQNNGAQSPAPAEDGAGGFTGLLPLIVLGVLLVMFVLMTSGQRKERKRHQQMLAALKKGDKVQTVGGIIGTLVEVRDDDVLVKVDENTNSRLRFARSAIKEILESKGEEGKDGKDHKDQTDT